MGINSSGLKGGCEASEEGSQVGREGSRAGFESGLRLFYSQFSADSHLLGENKVNRNLHIFLHRLQSCCATFLLRGYLSLMMEECLYSNSLQFCCATFL